MRLCVLVARVTIETESVESVCIIRRMDVVARVDRRFDSSTIFRLSTFFHADWLRWLYTGIKSFSFLCGTQRILGQKVSTKSRMAAIPLSPLREYCYYLIVGSNIRVKGDKMKRENNPIKLLLEAWCSLSVPQCAASHKGN